MTVVMVHLSRRTTADGGLKTQRSCPMVQTSSCPRGTLDLLLRQQVRLCWHTSARHHFQRCCGEPSRLSSALASRWHSYNSNVVLHPSSVKGNLSLIFVLASFQCSILLHRTTIRSSNTTLNPLPPPPLLQLSGRPPKAMLPPLSRFPLQAFPHINTCTVISPRTFHLLSLRRPSPPKHYRPLCE